MAASDKGLRYSLTPEYKAKKLYGIQREILSDEHYERTPTRHYGQFDPLAQTVEHINRCAACGAFARLTRNERRYQVKCVRCTGSGPVARKPWQAIVDWNKSPLSTNPSYRTLPLFGLASLAPAEAKERLIGIRRDLELRTKEAGLERNLGKGVGENYLQRLKALLAWCIYAQGLVKLEETHGDNA